VEHHWFSFKVAHLPKRIDAWDVPSHYAMLFTVCTQSFGPKSLPNENELRGKATPLSCVLWPLSMRILFAIWTRKEADRTTTFEAAQRAHAQRIASQIRGSLNGFALCPNDIPGRGRCCILRARCHIFSCPFPRFSVPLFVIPKSTGYATRVRTG
jgi:hypothetical protein